MFKCWEMCRCGGPGDVGADAGFLFSNCLLSHIVTGYGTALMRGDSVSIAFMPCCTNQMPLLWSTLRVNHRSFYY